MNNVDVIPRPEIDYKKVTLSSHYLMRLKERLPDVKDYRGYTIEAIENGVHYGITTDKDKKSYCHCFNYKDDLFFLSADDLRTMVTMYDIKEQSMSFPSSNEYQKNFNEKIKKFYNVEVRKIDRKLNSLKKKFEEFKYISDVECSQLKLRMYKTKSQSVKMECDSQITDIKLQLANYEKEIDTLEKCKNKVIKASSSVEKYVLST